MILIVLRIPHYFNMDYKIVFEFKDGKMKINAPSIIQIIHYFGTEVFYLSKRDVASKSLKYHLLFKENGEVKEKKHKENIEKKTNLVVAAILNEMKDSDW